jgi:hypothetical protein
MKFSNFLLVIVFGVLILLPAATFADTYHMATFSGQLGSSPNIKSPFAGNGFDPSGPITGSFVFDDNLIPAPGSGPINIFFSNFPDIAEIPPATAFTLSLGGLTFDLGDAQTPPFGTQEAAIQYNNGAFNGFFYVSDFMFQGNPYELTLQGSVLAIVPIVGGFPQITNHRVNARLNVGDANLTDITVFTPAQAQTPEPATGALLGIALLALVLIARKYGYRVAAI